MQRRAKVFMNNRSQVVRLPKEFQFSTDEIFIREEGEDVILSPSPRDWGPYLDTGPVASSVFMENVVVPEPVTPAGASTPFTSKQGQYLAFIYYYRKIHGRPPAESDFQRFFRVTPPVVHQMIKTLHAQGFIDREPGKPRSIKLRLTRAQLPDLD